MSDEEGFLQAIAAAPTDDLPRLVYADWLEERGDPRATYLRLATQTASQVREGLLSEDLRSVLRDTYTAAPAEWRGRVGPWFDVVLEAVHQDCRIGVLKVIKDLVHRRLAKAVDVVENLPSVVRGRLLLDEAEDLREQLEHGYGVNPWPSQRGPACHVTLRISSQAADLVVGPRRAHQLMTLFDIRTDDSHAGFIAAVNRGLDSEPGNPYLTRFGHVCSPSWWACFDRGEFPTEVLSGPVIFVGSRHVRFGETEDVIEFVSGIRVVGYDRVDHWAAVPICVGDRVTVNRTVAELQTPTGLMRYLIDLRAEWVATHEEQRHAEPGAAPDPPGT
jgi:uncharacterized protein (TIGR02996 family)